MNNLIAESIKRFNDLARKEIKHYDNMCDRGDFCICLQDVQADFLKQELTSIAEKTREDTEQNIKKAFLTYLFENRIEDDLKGRFASSQYDLIWKKIVNLSDKESK